MNNKAEFLTTEIRIGDLKGVLRDHEYLITYLYSNVNKLIIIIKVSF